MRAPSIALSNYSRKLIFQAIKIDFEDLSRNKSNFLGFAPSRQVSVRHNLAGGFIVVLGLLLVGMGAAQASVEVITLQTEIKIPGGEWGPNAGIRKPIGSCSSTLEDIPVDNLAIDINAFFASQDFTQNRFSERKWLQDNALGDDLSWSAYRSLAFLYMCRGYQKMFGGSISNRHHCPMNNMARWRLSAIFQNQVSSSPISPLGQKDRIGVDRFQTNFTGVIDASGIDQDIGAKLALGGSPSNLDLKNRSASQNNGANDDPMIVVRKPIKPARIFLGLIVFLGSAIGLGIGSLDLLERNWLRGSLLILIGIGGGSLLAGGWL
jgi:hypothetical protein